MLSRATLADATEKAEALRNEIAQFTIEEVPELSCSISIGVISANWQDKEVEYNDILKQADAAMYEAKKMGKNRVVAKEFEVPAVNINNNTIDGGSD